MGHEARLKELGLILPNIADPAGSYEHAVRTGPLLFLSGKGPLGPEGRVGDEIGVDEAYEHARQTGLILLAVMRRELGSLDRVSRVVKVLGMVKAIPQFDRHPQVIDGCSDLFLTVFGEAGRHARSAIGVQSLPFGITVEIECIVEWTD